MSICIDCGNGIQKARLRLIPGVLRCTKCQSARENLSKNFTISKDDAKPADKKISTRSQGGNFDNIKFFTCSKCNYKKNQNKDLPCAWCNILGYIR